jgi:hypothetical protein
MFRRLLCRFRDHPRAFVMPSALGGYPDESGVMCPSCGPVELHRCRGCGRGLTDDEREYYGTSCNACEGAWVTALENE